MVISEGTNSSIFNNPAQQSIINLKQQLNNITRKNHNRYNSNLLVDDGLKQYTYLNNGLESIPSVEQPTNHIDNETFNISKTMFDSQEGEEAHKLSTFLKNQTHLDITKSLNFPSLQTNIKDLARSFK